MYSHYFLYTRENEPAANEDEVEPNAAAANEDEVEPNAAAANEDEVEPNAAAGNEDEVEPNAAAANEDEVEPTAAAGNENPVAQLHLATLPSYVVERSIIGSYGVIAIIDIPEPDVPHLLRCASVDQKTQLLHLESQRSLLLKDEIELNRRCEEIVTSFLSSCTFFLTMIGMALIGSFVITNGLLLTVFVIFVSIFFSGVGCGSYVMYLKLKDMEWDFHCIGNRLNNLRCAVDSLTEHFKNESSGCWVPTQGGGVVGIDSEIARLSKILETVKHNGRFKYRHVLFLGFTLVCSMGYFVTVMFWMYNLHKGQPNLLISINPRRT